MGVLDGKAALVTGGSRGIGAAIVRRLAADGAVVTFTYVSSESAAADVVKHHRTRPGRRTGRRRRRGRLPGRPRQSLADRSEPACHRRAADLSTADLLADIDAAADPAVAKILAGYFKLEPGGYGHGDQMIGVKLSTIRGLLKPYLRADLPLAELEEALKSPIHEHRLAVLCLLADRASRSLKPRTANPAEATAIYELYLRSTPYINNWDLVDCSTSEIVGGYLLDKPRDVLYTLVRSSSLWERRIALVATHWFIRAAGESADTYALAALVLDDREDLIHKASGWMLREAGKRVSEDELLAFLDRHATVMPRTMLRYAIERLAPDVRKHYLQAR